MIRRLLEKKDPLEITQIKQQFFNHHSCNATSPIESLLPLYMPYADTV